MKIYIHELSEQPVHLHFTEKEPWCARSVEDTQETPLPSTPSFTFDFELRKLQDAVFLKGKFTVQIGVFCSRCANPMAQTVASQFQCMFTREQEYAHGRTNSGVAYSEPTGASEEDLDIEVLEKDYIELSDVLKEQIYLKMPFQPLCRENCKGICAVCGQDQNTNPCQCHRIKNSALANALKNFRV